MFQPGAMLYVQSFGTRPENVEVPFYANRAPTSTDVNFPIGKRWIYIGNSVWVLLSQSTVGGNLSSNWVQLADSDGSIQSVVGTANQVTVTTAAGVATLTIPSTFIAPGSIAASTTLTATLGNITATNGNLALGTAGNKISIATGANASVGTSGAMTAGAITVNTTAVTANSLIFAVPAVLGTVTLPQAYYISAKVAGTSFTITSADATDTSTWNYWIIN